MSSVPLATLSHSVRRVPKIVARVCSTEPIVQSRGTDFLLSIHVKDDSVAVATCVNLFGINKRQLPSVRCGDAIILYYPSIFFDVKKCQFTLFGKMQGKSSTRLQMRLFRDNHQVWFCHVEYEVSQEDVRLDEQLNPFVAQERKEIVLVPQAVSPVRPEVVTHAQSSSSSTAIPLSNVNAAADIPLSSVNAAERKSAEEEKEGSAVSRPSKRRKIVIIE